MGFNSGFKVLTNIKFYRKKWDLISTWRIITCKSYVTDINFEVVHIPAVLKFCLLPVKVILCKVLDCGSRSQWPLGLRRRSAAARLLRSWVRIPPRAWIFVCCECCVLSSRGLCDELIPCPEGVILSVVRHRVWFRNLKNEEAMTRVGSQRHSKKKKILFTVYNFTFWRFCRVDSWFLKFYFLECGHVK